MTLCVAYASKAKLKEAVGQSLKYVETSAFGPEYRETGVLTVAGRPSVTSVVKREFFARVTMESGKITKVV